MLTPRRLSPFKRDVRKVEVFTYKPEMRGHMSVTYETDFHAWTEQQASILKSRCFSELDFENLIEEIESMGASQRESFKSHLRILLMHLLKWKYQPEKRSTSWLITIKRCRLDLVDLLATSPSFKSRLDEFMLASYNRARTETSTETGLLIKIFPLNCEWSFEQVMDINYLPSPEVLNDDGN